MNLPELPRNSSRTEMRKALIRLRMEMHRQEIRHESGQLLQPLHRLRGMGQNLHDGKGTRSGAGVGSLTRLIRLGTTLGPLVKLVMQGSSRKH